MDEMYGACYEMEDMRNGHTIFIGENVYVCVCVCVCVCM
jgi:hypothetical protein